jgi:hypothetical protein
LVLTNSVGRLNDDDFQVCETAKAALWPEPHGRLGGIVRRIKEHERILLGISAAPKPPGFGQRKRY